MGNTKCGPPIEDLEASTGRGPEAYLGKLLMSDGGGGGKRTLLKSSYSSSTMETNIIFVFYGGLHNM
jgi:hypothetical protein